MFLKTGRASDAGKATEHLGRDLRKTWFQGGKLGEEPNLKEFGEALIRFGADLETLRTGDLLIGRGAVDSSADKLLKAAKDARANALRHAPPLADILDQVIAIAEPLAGQRTDLSGTSGRTAVAALADVYLRFRRFSETVATVREGWINFYAAEAALCPGDERFNADERFRAECLARAIDKNFRSIGNRRNDLLHAQYKSRKEVQDGPGMERAVREIVGKFKTSQPIESAGGHSEEKLSVRCFVNLTNHPSANWDEAQTKTALALAERIEDIAFPAVPPDADEKAIQTLAETCMAKISPETSHALVQGEFTLTVELVRRLRARGVTCLAATSTRDVEEDAVGRRVSAFKFVRFRTYLELRAE
jgi:hypothetical protein